MDLPTLAEWAKADRVRPNTMLKEFATGRPVPASTVPGLFQPMAAPIQPAAQGWSQAPSYYNRPAAAPIRSGDHSAVIWSIGYAVLAVVMFFALGGLGVIFGVYGVINAFRSKANGHAAAPVAIVISIVALVAVLIGWGIRLSSMAH